MIARKSHTTKKLTKKTPGPPSAGHYPGKNHMFPFCFRSLLALSISIAVAAFPARQSKAVGAVEGSRSPGVLQFTSGSHLLEFETNAIYVAGSSHALRIQFVDSCTTAPMTAGADDHAKGAAPLSQVSYSNIWDGVSLTYDAPSDGIVRSTYRVAPHADVDAIRLRYNAPIAVQDDGSLRVTFKTGTINESAPKAWQERDGKRVAVQVAFAAHSARLVGRMPNSRDRERMWTS